MSNCCLSPQAASGTAACKRRAAAAADGHAHPPPQLLPPTAAATAAPHRANHNAPSPRPPAPLHGAIILHPHHAYRPHPRPLPVVLPPPRQAIHMYHHNRSSSSGPSLSATLPIDLISAVAARLGDGKSLASFAAVCRACKSAAYDERLWRRECERRFGPIMVQPPSSSADGQEGSGSGNNPHHHRPQNPLSWRRLYAFNAHAYDAVVAATREAERARAMTRLLGASAARRWVVGRAALGGGGGGVAAA